jgi:cytochrome c-type biogenesis protein CcmE
MQRKTGLIIFSLIAVSLVITLIVTYAGQVSQLYLYVDELFEKISQSAQIDHQGPQSIIGKQLRVHGKLKPQSTSRYPGRLEWQFAIVGDSGRELRVQYRGVLPDTFRDDAELVIEGKLQNPALFLAHFVFAKCPTKYKDEKSHPANIKPHNQTSSRSY